MWFRLYTELIDDPKAQWLSGDDFKGWINILCLAKENDGLLPSTKVIAFKLRMTEAEAKHLVEALTSAELLDQTDEGITPHNWDTRQFISDDDPTAAIRSRRYRQRNVTRDATSDDTDASLPPEQRQSRAETDSESEQSREPRAPKRTAARRRTQCDEELFSELQANPAYAMFDVRMIYHKMAAWCKNKGKVPTPGRLVNWLNREERPLTASFKPPKGNAHVGKSPPPFGNDAYMAESVEELIAMDDIASIGQLYDAIVSRGGAKAEWEVRCVAWYELHKDEPATPEQMAELDARIQALAKR